MKTYSKIIVLGFFTLGIFYRVIEYLLKALNIKKIYRYFVAGTIVLALGIVTYACSSTKDKYIDVPTNTVTDGSEEFKMEKSGAQLWGEVCNRCHIAPSPSDYNDTDWETISLHMRVRANLTEKESKKIEEFLKSAN